MKYLRPLSILSVLMCLALVLAWNDVLPGGWRLRGLVLGEQGRDSRMRERHAAERLELFRSERESVADGAIVFLGSSTIERFPLQAVFPGKPCLNRGINGDTIPELASRLASSMPAREPAGLVVAIGGNDLRREHASANEVIARATSLMDELALRYPLLPMVWIGLFGELQASEDELERTSSVNAALQRAAEERGISFLSTEREPLVDSAGRLQQALAADRYHLNEAGYILLGGWIVNAEGAVGHLLSP